MTDYEILQMRESGYTYQQIADIEGVSRQAIHQRIKPIKHKKAPTPKDYYSHDITFCTNKMCANEKCKRNPCHIRWDFQPYQSFADFENTEHCAKKKEKVSDDK